MDTKDVEAAVLSDNRDLAAKISAVEKMVGAAWSMHNVAMASAESHGGLLLEERMERWAATCDTLYRELVATHAALIVERERARFDRARVRVDAYLETGAMLPEEVAALMEVRDRAYRNYQEAVHEAGAVA